MDFSFTDEQTMLGESLAGTAQRGGGTRAIMELGAGSALLSEEAGGFGGTGSDILMVFRTLGHEAVVTPLIDSVILGAGILAGAGKTELAEQASTGEITLAVAIDEPGQRYEGTIATQARDGKLTGEKTLVYGAEDASHLIVAASDGLYLVEAGADGLEMRAYDLMDGGRAAEITLSEVAATRIADMDVLARPKAAAILAICADALGVMEKAIELTTAYLGTRKQFGRPIGSFQALQHRMADLLTEVEHAKSSVWNLAGALDSGAAQRDRNVAATKSLVGRTACLVAEETIQLHGGIGMTEEYELAPLARRLIAAETRFGDSDYHLERFIALSAS